MACMSASSASDPIQMIHRRHNGKLTLPRRIANGAHQKCSNRSAGRSTSVYMHLRRDRSTPRRHPPRRRMLVGRVYKLQVIPMSTEEASHEARTDSTLSSSVLKAHSKSAVSPLGAQGPIAGKYFARRVTRRAASRAAAWCT